MKQTNGKHFVDSNVFIYLLGSDVAKKSIAKTILRTKPQISVQVISENINVLIKKFKLVDSPLLATHIGLLKSNCFVNDLTFGTIEYALVIKSKYNINWYDATIVSSALLSGSTLLYSEDMQHGQIIENQLKIINPFL